MSNLSRGDLAEITAGIRPAAAFKTITFDGGIQSGKLSTKAALTTTLTGTNNDLVFTADTAGLAGNNVAIQYKDPKSTVARAINVNVNAGTTKLITVELAVASLTEASKVLTSTNTEVADGDTVTVGTIVYRFKDTMAQANDVKRHGTTADTTMGNLIKAINGTGTEGVEYFAGTQASPVATAGTLAAHAFTLTAKAGTGKAGNSIAIAESSAQLSWAGGATNLSGGLDAGQIISTAANVKTAVDAHTEAAALVDIANSGADDGSGVVTAMAATNLSGGSDGTVPLFTVKGSIICSLRGYIATDLAGTNATLVHGVTGTTNMLIPILTSTTLVKPKGIDKSAAVVARGTALDKVPLWHVCDENIFATTATAATSAGKINYVLDYIAVSDGATVTPA
jgi:hypothetical protein